MRNYNEILLKFTTTVSDQYSYTYNLNVFKSTICVNILFNSIIYLNSIMYMFVKTYCPFN